MNDWSHRGSAQVLSNSSACTVANFKIKVVPSSLHMSSIANHLGVTGPRFRSRSPADYRFSSQLSADYRFSSQSPVDYRFCSQLSADYRFCSQ